MDWGAGVFQQWGLGDPPRRAGKMSKLDHLEEVKVVTRFP